MDNIEGQYLSMATILVAEANPTFFLLPLLPCLLRSSPSPTGPPSPLPSPKITSSPLDLVSTDPASVPFSLTPLPAVHV